MLRLQHACSSPHLLGGVHLPVAHADTADQLHHPNARKGAWRKGAHNGLACGPPGHTENHIVLQLLAHHQRAQAPERGQGIPVICVPALEHPGRSQPEAAHQPRLQLRHSRDRRIESNFNNVLFLGLSQQPGHCGPRHPCSRADLLL